MKKKYLITTLGLSLVLGLGLVAGLGNVKEGAVSAEGEENIGNVYLELGENWGEANAYYTVHYWGGESTASVWPGAELNAEAAKGQGTVLKTEWDTRATHCIIVRWGDAEHTTEWNRWEYFGDSHEFEVGKYNYFVSNSWDSCASKYAYEAIIHVEDEVKTRYAFKGEEFNPSAPYVEGKYFEDYYMDAEFTVPYCAEEPTGDIELYAKMNEFENTGWISFPGYGWTSHNVYVYETINGKTYYLRGAYGSESTKAWKADNVTFDGKDLYICSFKYHNATNVKFLLNDGTDSNKSVSTQFHAGINNCGAYYEFSSEASKEGQLVVGENSGRAAKFIFDFVCKLTVKGYETAYGERDYSVCALTAEQKASIIATYNEIREESSYAKGLIDGASLRTYVYGDGTFSEYGAVSFADILNEVAGFDLVNNAAAPARVGLYPSTQPAFGIVIASAFIAMASVAFIALKKKKATR